MGSKIMNWYWGLAGFQAWAVAVLAIGIPATGVTALVHGAAEAAVMATFTALAIPAPTLVAAGAVALDTLEARRRR